VPVSAAKIPRRSGCRDQSETAQVVKDPVKKILDALFLICYLLKYQYLFLLGDTTYLLVFLSSSL
jgi:hypothetical protein